VAGLEFALSILDGQGLIMADRMVIVTTLYSTVMAVSLNAAAEARGRARMRVTEDEVASSTGPYPARIIERGEFPRFTEFITGVTATVTHDQATGPRHEMRVAVELILDGAAARIAAARATGQAENEPGSTPS
jgi:hypothetical protein